MELLGISCKKHVVVDTNIILNRPNTINELTELCDFVYVPQTVISELNYLKDRGNQSRKQLAGLCMNKISNLKEKLVVGGESNSGANNDDKILNYALEIAKNNPSDTVYLLSDDKDFKLKNKGKAGNFKVIESRDFDSVFKASEYNTARSQRFFDFVNRGDIQNLKKYDLTGVDVNYVDVATGETPLICAVRKKPKEFMEIIKFLISLPSIDLNRVDNKKYGFPPLSHALQMHRIDIVQLLLENGANVNAPSENEKNPYNTPLMIAAWNGWKGKLDEVKLLLENGACINQQDKGNGFTALIKAAFKDNVEIVQYLLDAGADATICSFSGKTALDYAYEKNFKEIIEILRQKG